MTQPPDDAALVARLRTLGAPLEGTDRDGAGHSLQGRAMWDAATALEAKDRRIAEVMTAPATLESVARAMAKANYPGGGQGDIDQMWEGWAMEAGAAINAIRAALEPSDKGVGR